LFIAISNLPISVKVLDFGIARMLETNSPEGDETLRTDATAPGTVLGTAAYMSPEQSRGQPADRRTDVWAFGCVLYEMLTGRALFREKTVTETLAKVLQGQVGLEALPPQTPPSVVRLVQRCLQRDPRERLQHIGDARVEIRDALSGSVSHSTGLSTVGVKSWWRFAGVAVLVVLAMLSGWYFTRRTIPNSIPVTTRSFIGSIPASARMPFGTRSVALSLDGARLAYVSGKGLFVRPLSRTEAVSVSGAASGLINLVFFP
jgi:eukaryotic-like serine/threonine-protein kinase